jgi:serine/threonine-protein kinase
MPKARIAVERALAIDPMIAEAHAALGFILVFFDRDTAAARREFQRAIELKPGYAPSHGWGTTPFSALGRQEDSVAMGEGGVRAEPFSPVANALLGWALIYAGRPAEAVTRLQPLMEREPAFFVGHWVLGMALISAGRTDDGVAALRRSVELSGRLPWMLATLGCGFVCARQSDQARMCLDELNRRAGSEYVPAFPLAMLHAFLGDEPAAVACLERAITDGDPALTWIRVDTGPIAPMAIPAS